MKLIYSQYFFAANNRNNKNNVFKGENCTAKASSNDLGLEAWKGLSATRVPLTCKAVVKSGFTSYCGNSCSVGFIKMFISPNIWHTSEKLLAVDMRKSILAVACWAILALHRGSWEIQTGEGDTEPVFSEGVLEVLNKRQGPSWKQIWVAKREAKVHSWLLDKRPSSVEQGEMLGLVSTAF